MSELSEIVGILEGKPPKSTGPATYNLGFSFSPRDGHRLVLPPSQAIWLAHAHLARLVVRGTSRLVFAVDCQLSCVEGTWCTPWTAIYAAHKDPRCLSYLECCESHLLPALALSLDIHAVNDVGRSIATKKATLPIELLVNLNARVARAKTASYKHSAIKQAVDVLSRCHDQGHDFILHLQDPE